MYKAAKDFLLQGESLAAQQLIGKALLSFKLTQVIGEPINLATCPDRALLFDLDYPSGLEMALCFQASSGSLGVNLYGLSNLSTPEMTALARQYELTLPLLCDPEDDVLAWLRTSGLSGGLLLICGGRVEQLFVTQGDPQQTVSDATDWLSSPAQWWGLMR